MDKTQIITLYNQDQRIDVLYPDMRKEVLHNLVRHIATSGMREGMVIYSDLDEFDADETIQRQIQYFESINQDFEWKLFDYDKPSDLKDRLASLGFIIEEAEALVLLYLDDAPGYCTQPVHHDVRRITDPGQLLDIQRVEEAVWEEDSSWVNDYLGGALREYPQQMSVYVAYIDNQPASAAWIYFPENSQFASLWGGATLQEYRKRGLYTALLAVRAQEARSRGVRYLTVDASPMSRPILEKFGFEFVAYTHPCKWKR